MHPPIYFGRTSAQLSCIALLGPPLLTIIKQECRCNQSPKNTTGFIRKGIIAPSFSIGSQLPRVREQQPLDLSEGLYLLKEVDQSEGQLNDEGGGLIPGEVLEDAL